MDAYTYEMSIPVDLRRQIMVKIKMDKAEKQVTKYLKRQQHS